MKSIETKILGVLCWVLAAWLLWQGNDANEYDIHRISDSLHYLVLPFLAFAVGTALMFCASHSHVRKVQGEHEEKHHGGRQ